MSQSDEQKRSSEPLVEEEQAKRPREMADDGEGKEPVSTTSQHEQPSTSGPSTTRTPLPVVRSQSLTTVPPPVSLSPVPATHLQPAATSSPSPASQSAASAHTRKLREYLAVATKHGVSRESLAVVGTHRSDDNVIDEISKIEYVRLKAACHAAARLNTFGLEMNWSILQNMHNQQLDDLYYLLCDRKDRMFSGEVDMFLLAYERSLQRHLDYNTVSGKFSLGEARLSLGRSAALSARRCCDDSPSHESFCFYAARYLRDLIEEKNLKEPLPRAEDLYNELLNIKTKLIDDAIASGNDDAMLKLVEFILNKSADELFQEEYHDTHEFLQWVCAYLNKSINLFMSKPRGSERPLETQPSTSNVRMTQDEPRMYAPYVPIIQSSGSGKTRLALQLPSKFYTFYMCLRKHGVRGDPGRSVIADLFEGLDTAIDFLRFYLAVFQVFWRTIENVSNLPRRFCSTLSQNVIDSCGKKTGFWNDVIVEYTAMLNAVALRAVAEGGLIDEVVKLWRLIKAKLEKHRVYQKIIFVIDEASALLKPVGGQANQTGEKKFENWRRAIEGLQVDSFFIILDTSSKISNFNPPKQLDPSTRVSRYGEELYPSIFALPMRGAVKLGGESKRFALTCASNDDLDDRYKKLRFLPSSVVENNRPMYAHEFRVDTSDSEQWLNAFDTVVSLAKFKLLYEQELTPADVDKFRLQRIALLSCRFSVRSLNYMTSDLLVANHSATLVYMNRARDSAHVHYLAEPILSEAAARIMGNPVVFKRLLDGLLIDIRDATLGIMSPRGDMGELATTMILSRVADRIAGANSADLETIMYSKPVSLRSFIATIHPHREVLQADFAAYVNFTKWIQVDRKPDTKMIRRAWNLHTGIVGKPMQEDIDLLIPVLVRPRLADVSVSGGGDGGADPVIAEPQARSKAKQGVKTGARARQGVRTGARTRARVLNAETEAETTIDTFTIDDNHFSAMFVQVKNTEGPWIGPSWNGYIDRMNQMSSTIFADDRWHVNVLVQTGAGGISGVASVMVFGKDVGGTKIGEAAAESVGVEIAGNCINIIIPSIQSLSFLDEETRKILVEISGTIPVKDSLHELYKCFLDRGEARRTRELYNNFLDDELGVQMAGWAGPKDKSQ